MIHDAHQIVRVSSLEKIEMSRIEFISFYYTNGCFSHAFGDKINHNFLHTMNDAPIRYAFVNMIGGEFIIVDVNI